MPLSAEDKDEIAKIVAVSLETERERRRRAFAEAPPEPPPEKETKLFLITMIGNQIAFPDERGRAVLHQTIYARVTRVKDRLGYYGSNREDVEVVAYGDGTRLPQPFKAVLADRWVAMVEVSETVLGLWTYGGSPEKVKSAGE